MSEEQYKLPELEEMKKDFEEFYEKAQEFIRKQKELQYDRK